MKATFGLFNVLVLVLAATAGAEGIPVGVCDLPEPGAYGLRTCAHSAYVHEFLRHAGLAYSRVSADKIAETLPSLRILVTVGSGSLPEETRSILDTWIGGGGVWISAGTAGGVPDWFGVEMDHPRQTYWHGDMPCTLGEGYMTAEPGDSALAPVLPIPLHFFNGIAVRPTTGRVLARVLDAHQRPTPRAAMVENIHGQGRCILIAPDVTGTVIHIQQGTAVTRDHVPAPDGSGSISDGVLITEDGMTLDWIFDRQPVPGTGGLPAFTQPVADLWKEVLLRTILQSARERGVTVPILWFYPRNLPALGHLSHDTDGNDPAGAQRMLENLEKANVRSTWCVLLPGYPREVIERIGQSGHELAAHYDAYSVFADWRQDRFGEQIDKLTELFGMAPVSNKNHVLRWEGETEFYGWCEAKGIQLDESKGDCQTGETGFMYGTCHPYQPISPEGKVYDVLELCTATQDLVMTAPVPVGDMILDGALRHHGVAHFLFHPAHSTIPAVADAMFYVLAQGKSRGLEWWTARDINTWERSRRTAEWSSYRLEEHDGHGRATVTFRTAGSLPQATVLWLAPGKSKAKTDGRRQEGRTVERWGFSFLSVTCDLLSGREHELSVAW